MFHFSRSKVDEAMAPPPPGRQPGLQPLERPSPLDWGSKELQGLGAGSTITAGNEFQSLGVILIYNLVSRNAKMNCLKEGSR